MTQESVAKILIVNENSEVLVLQTSEWKERPDKSHQPDLPGGLVDPGESERSAVVREVREETGIILDPDTTRLAYAETKFYTDENKSVTKLLYVVQLAITPPVTISWEHEAFEWCRFDQLLEEYSLRPFYTQAVRYINDNRILND